MKPIGKIGLALTIAFSISTSAFAQVQYTDVAQVHWAYESIQKVSDKKWMTGNLQNEFKPNKIVDYFEFSQIAAKVAGYKDPLIEEVTAEQKQLQEQAYKENENILTNYTNRFTRWEKQYKNYNQQIAYLLYKGILKETDLAKFIIEQESGTEVVRSLKREDMAAFVVRLIGKESEALKNTLTTGFDDESLISSSIRPHAAYLRQAGIFQGSEFNPKGEVTKAVLAKVLVESMTLNSTDKGKVKEDKDLTDEKEIYIHGTVTYIGNGYIGIQDGNNKTSYYSIKEGARFYIGSKETNIESIEKGNKVLIQPIKENNVDYISKIIVQEDKKSPEEVKPVVPNPGPNTNADNTNTNTNTETTPVSTRRLEGVVEAVGNTSINIMVKYIGYQGEIRQEVELYNINPNTIITKGNKTILPIDITKGNIIIAEVKGNLLYKAVIMDKQREVIGSLVEKKRIKSLNSMIIKVDQETLEYQIPTDIKIAKKGLENAAWNDLRIGDKITLDLEYDKVVGINAEGFASEVEGIIEEVLISATQSKITIRLNDNSVKTYPLIYGARIARGNRNENLTLYDVRLGQKVKAYLDSLEIEEMALGNQTQVTTVQGYIDGIDFINNYLDLRTNSDFTGIKRIRLEKEVEVFRGDKRLNRRDLEEEMLIVITLKSYGSDQASTINIIAK
ncbi:MAG: S-layer homology domain-containing protein [Epulopiscium sp.]|nr:S-layer homology domain-containing protein [Candidatus Epulonipiscium sp.]